MHSFLYVTISCFSLSCTIQNESEVLDFFTWKKQFEDFGLGEIVMSIFFLIFFWHFIDSTIKLFLSISIDNENISLVAEPY